LVDMAVADGAATISVVAVLADQAELFGTVTSTTGPDVWTRFFDLRRCQPGVPGDQAFLLDLAL